MKEKHIIRRTLSEKRSGRTDWKAVEALTDEEIESRVVADPDSGLWTEEDLAAARLVLPAERSKLPVSIRLDREVLEYFKEGGAGYQSRINAVLKSYVRSRRKEYGDS